MTTLGELAPLLTGDAATRFLSEHPNGLLLCKTRLLEDGERVAAPTLQFHTGSVRLAEVKGVLAGGPSASSAGPAPLLPPAQWAVMPVQKRQGNPYPERISIGRALNCDVVVRAAGVSKLHAHLLLNPGAMLLLDLRSANGTFVNEARVTDPSGAEVKLGDTLRLGPVLLQWVTPSFVVHAASGLR